MMTLFSNKKCLVLFVLLSITACQQTPKVNNAELATNDHLATPNAIAQSLMSSAEPLISTPIVHDDIWQRIRSQLSITVPDNKEVAKWRKYYLRHPNFMVTISERAEPFLYYIVEEIETEIDVGIEEKAS